MAFDGLTTVFCCAIVLNKGCIKFIIKEELLMKKWVCIMCGHEHEGETPPDVCVVCGVDSTNFQER